MACDVALVTLALKGEKIGNLDGTQFRIYDAPQGVALDRVVSWPTAEEIGGIFKAMETTKAEIIELTNQKNRLGI